MSVNPKYSIIVPVYNRPQEIKELLQSLTNQVFKNFEVLIVEDGSTDTCVEVYEQFTDVLQIQYFFKPNSGPGPSRNFGFAQAKGNYFVVFDYPNSMVDLFRLLLHNVRIIDYTSLH